MLAMMNLGPGLVKGLVWGACLFYALGLRQALAARGDEGGGRRARRFLTIGGGLYLLHAALGFQFFHNWSHESYYVTMEMQTFDAVQVRTGVAAYASYLFTAVWVAELAWAWACFSGWQNRSRLVFWLIHSLLLAVFGAGMVVFATGPVRWFSTAVLLGAALWLCLGRTKSSAIANQAAKP
jgi:hypothetical protein